MKQMHHFKAAWVFCAAMAFLILSLAIGWFLKPLSLWEYPFHVLRWIQMESSFKLTELTPFAWNKVCLADRTYYDDVAYQALNTLVGVAGFDSRSLPIHGDEQGGYLIFVLGNKATPIEWNRFAGFGQGAFQNTGCWDNTLIIKQGRIDGKIEYRPI